MKLRLVADAASLEVFADEGTTVLTAVYFPEMELNKLEISTPSSIKLSFLKISKVNYD
jgi:fructan beta-fructosidase